MTWLDSPGHFIFFTGKGGVGKTSLACATAVELADRGKRVLLVSTDPATNLDQVLAIAVGTAEPTSVPGVPGLQALNIDPEAAAQAYRDRIVSPVKGVLPDQAVRSIEEQLSGACTTEIAAFDEFTALLTSANQQWDHLVFDTAPTGHTLRLLSLPGAWSDFLDTSEGGASCLGPLAGLEKQRAQYAAAVAALSDPAQSTVVLVSRAQGPALTEAARTSAELRDLGLSNQRLILNAVLPPQDGSDPLTAALQNRQQEALNALPQPLRSLPVDSVPLRAFNVVGLEAVRSLVGRREPLAPRFERASIPAGLSSLGELVDALEAQGHGLLLVMGKGGVGKTTVAAAVAVELASRGHEVHLTTTDPAAHVQTAVRGRLEHLEISRIDPHAETERYRKHVLETRGKDLDEHGRSLLEEDLRSPCTEEIAVFQAFSQAISEARRKFVVVDTAPTGHTLLLIDATGAYHRDVMRHVKGMTVRTPLMRLQDPELTRVLIVTLAETTPVQEAAHLQEDLRRAGIEPWAWVINSSLAAADPVDPLLRARALTEVPEIERVQAGLARRLALVPFLAQEPVGLEGLAQLTRSELSPDPASAGQA